MMKIILLLFAVVAFPSMALSADGALAQRVAELEKKLNSRWLDKVELSGVVEIEAGYTDAEGDKSSDIDLTNVELGIDVSLTDFAAAFVLFKWEDDDDGVVIDEGGISLGSIDDNGFALTLGKLYVPFGVYDSSFVADPLTLELGETREGAVVVDFATQGFYGSAYAFNSELDKAGDDDKLDAFGVKLGYALENDRLAFDVSAGYISNITSSGGFVDGLGRGTSIADQSAGATFAAIISVADVTFTGEYVATLDSNYSSTGTSEPTALHLELSYGFDFVDHPSSVAVTYQQTDEAKDLGLAESRYGAAFCYEIVEGLGVTLEYLRNENYDDTEEDSLTCQLALEF